ncbi:TPA: hypothetical protein DEP21_04605 [Patescibacteria group bacterium]|nr:hypothetical protein [Candidatus Gracilibacteria bacterium]
MDELIRPKRLLLLLQQRVLVLNIHLLHLCLEMYWERWMLFMQHKKNVNSYHDSSYHLTLLILLFWIYQKKSDVLSIM